MSVEQVFLFAVILLIPLIQLLMRMFRNRTTPQEPALKPLQPKLVVKKPAQHTTSSEPSRTARLPVRISKPRFIYVTGRKPINLRQAVVLMTLVGPCRAENPYD